MKFAMNAQQQEQIIVRLVQEAISSIKEVVYNVTPLAKHVQVQILINVSLVL